jgi:hypothetical protein
MATTWRSVYASPSAVALCVAHWDKNRGASRTVQRVGRAVAGAHYRLGARREFKTAVTERARMDLHGVTLLLAFLSVCRLSLARGAARTERGGGGGRRRPASPTFYLMFPLRCKKHPPHYYHRKYQQEREKMLSPDHQIPAACMSIARKRPLMTDSLFTTVSRSQEQLRCCRAQ